MLIKAGVDSLPEETREKLALGLSSYADLAFAHLDHVVVEDAPEGVLVLFAWLRRGGLRWMRLSLNRLSEIVAEALPSDRFVDLVILNSAPELLQQVEAAGGLLVENDPEERRKVVSHLIPDEV